MKYSEQILSNKDSAMALVGKTGYSTVATVSAVSSLMELSLLETIFYSAMVNYKKGDLLPTRFETEIDVSCFQTPGNKNLDLLQRLIDSNVVVPLGGNRYRVMLSALMNRLFSLTSNCEDEGVRRNLSGAGDHAPLQRALDRLEWEFVQEIHDSIDSKYLDINTLEERVQIEDLLIAVEKTSDASTRLAKSGGLFMGSAESISNCYLSEPGGNLRMIHLKLYLGSLIECYDKLKDEGTREWSLIEAVSAYPRSFLGRKSAPVVKSSWSLNSNFRSHPLILKFQSIIEKNQVILSKLVDSYSEQISLSVDQLEQLPNPTGALEILEAAGQDIRDSQAAKGAWALIKKQTPALKAQAKLMQSLVGSLEKLYVTVTD